MLIFLLKMEVISQKNNVSIELGKHTDNFLADNMTKAHKGVLMHAIFLCA